MEKRKGACARKSSTKFGMNKKLIESLNSNFGLMFFQISLLKNCTLFHNVIFPAN